MTEPVPQRLCLADWFWPEPARESGREHIFCGEAETATSATLKLDASLPFAPIAISPPPPI
jgi:hypothetical protein